MYHDLCIEYLVTFLCTHIYNYTRSQNRFPNNLSASFFFLFIKAYRYFRNTKKKNHTEQVRLVRILCSNLLRDILVIFYFRNKFLILLKLEERLFKLTFCNRNATYVPLSTCINTQHSLQGYSIKYIR